MADKREFEEKQQVFQARGMPDVIPSSEFASTALKALEKDIMHELSSREIRACTNDILNREMLQLADEMAKFRSVIGSRIMEDESLDESGPVQLSRLRQASKPVGKCGGRLGTIERRKPMTRSSVS